MHRWLRAFSLELRLLRSNPVLLVLPVLFGAWMVYSLAGIAPPVSQDLYLYVYDFHKVKHTLTLGAAMLLGILLIRRDTAKTAYEWTAGLPVSPAVLFSVKYAAGLLYLSLFTAAMAVVYVYFALHYGIGKPIMLRELSFFAIQYEWSYMVTLALAMLLAIAIRNRIVYLIGFCAWVFGTFFIDQFIIERLGILELRVLKPFHLSGMTLDSFYANEAWGPWIKEQETWLARWFVLSFTLVLLTVCVTILKWARPSGTRARWAGALILFTVLSAGSYYTYVGFWTPHFAAYREQLRNAPTESVYNQRTITQFTVFSYKMELAPTSSDGLKASVEVSLRPADLPQGDVSFTLHDYFHVEQLLLDNQPVSFTRRGNLISVESRHFDSSKSSQTLTFNYESKGINWTYGPQQGEQIISFVMDPYLYLPNSAAWYPLPNNGPLYLTDERKKELFYGGPQPLAQPADFDVTFKGFSNYIYGSITEKQGAAGNQHFEQKGVKHLTFIAGNLIQFNDAKGSIKLQTTPGNRLEADLFWKDILRMKAYYEALLQTNLSAVHNIVYLSYGNLISPDSRQSAVAGSSYYINESRNHNLDDYQRIRTTYALLFGDDSYQSSYAEVSKDANGNTDETVKPSIFMEIRAAFLYLYYRDGLQLTEEQIRSVQFSDQFLPKDRMTGDRGLGQQIKNHILLQVREALDAGKTEEVKRVLASFYKKGLSAPDAPFRYPVVTLDDWNREWAKVFGS
ncbi:hypothetical protein ACI48J_26340 [Paenibacillus chitinolyticus]|uniref:hypothetical protein n=1 Tax=Paenibacillus chitinolyticus TaxID=79263 RepID=UPI0038640B19